MLSGGPGWNQKNSALQIGGHELWRANLHVADCFSLGKFEPHPNLRAVVSSLPEGERNVTAQQAVSGLAVAQRDELRRKQPFVGGVIGKAAVALGNQREPR